MLVGVSRLGALTVPLTRIPVARTIILTLAQLSCGCFAAPSTPMHDITPISPIVRPSAARVVFCPDAACEAASGAAYRPLGREAGCSWGVVEDPELVRLTAQGVPLTLLYLHQEDLADALADLPAADCVAAILRRAQHFKALSGAWPYLMHLEEMAVLSASATEPARVGAHLEVLRWMTARRRFESTPLADLLVYALEDQTRVVHELRDAARGNLLVEPAAYAAELLREADEAEANALALGDSLRRLGKPDFARGLLHIGLERALFVEPVTPGWVRQLQLDGRPTFTWDRGCATAASLRDAEVWVAGGLTTVQLYRSPDALHQRLAEQTAAQILRDLSPRRAQPREFAAKELPGELSRVRLEALVSLLIALDRARTISDPSSSTLTRIVEQATASLQRATARVPPPTDEAPLSTIARRFQLDGELFRALAALAGDITLVEDVQQALVLQGAAALTGFGVGI